MGFRRQGQKYSITDRNLLLASDDVLVIRANSRSLKQFVDENRLQLGGIKPGKADLSYGEVEPVEAVVIKGSTSKHSSAQRLGLRELFGIHMFAIARQGVTILQKLKDVRFHSGDVLLLQMPTGNLRNTLARLGLLPLARRDLYVTRVRKLVVATVIFGTAIAVTTMDYFPAAVAFTVAAVTMILCRVINFRQAHDNAATAIVMAPIAASVAESLNVSPDPFLMAVAISASCAFLTPVVRQSNTLVLGPDG